MTYLELKKKQQKEVDDFPMVFAFTNKQLEEGMKKLNLTINDKDKICSVPGGGFIKKTDSMLLLNLFKRHRIEMDDAIKADTTGERFIYQMFDYELGNHEYEYTGEIENTLNCLDLTIEDINKSESLKNGLKLAMKHQNNISIW